MISAPCKLLDWDSAFWGFRVATVTAGDRLNEDRASAVTEWCLEHQVRCLYFSADGTCPTTLALAARDAYRFVDVRIDLGRDLGPSSGLRGNDVPCELHVRGARAEDVAEARRLAGECHIDARFFKDTRFPEARAAEMYRRWIDADYARGELVVASLASAPEEPVGYVSYSLPATDRGRIGLIGVATGHRGRGVAAALLDCVTETLRGIGCRHVDVATQATNLGALRLYSRRGFVPTSSRVWFHRWW